MYSCSAFAASLVALNTLLASSRSTSAALTRAACSCRSLGRTVAAGAAVPTAGGFWSPVDTRVMCIVSSCDKQEYIWKEGGPEPASTCQRQENNDKKPISGVNVEPGLYTGINSDPERNSTPCSAMAAALSEAGASLAAASASAHSFAGSGWAHPAASVMTASASASASASA